MKIPSTKKQIPGPDRIKAEVIFTSILKFGSDIGIQLKVAPGRAQTNTNVQNSKFKTGTWIVAHLVSDGMFWLLEIRIWKLFGIWSSIFGILEGVN